MASFESLPPPTIVRIKRRHGSESSENIIISSKRKRPCLDEEEEGENDSPNPENIYRTIFKKLATLKSGDSVEIETNKAVQNVMKRSEELKQHYKKGINSSVKELIKRKDKAEVAAIRFKIVCSKRNLDENVFEKPSKHSRVDFHLIDASNDENVSTSIASSSNKTDIIACNGVPMESEKIQYVYDLYYSSLPVELFSWIDNICEIQRYNALDYTDEASKEEESNLDDEDEDDENEESNWRNDYPDEEEGDMYDDEDDFLCKQMQKAKIESDDSDDSYDVNEYDESGDFDENGDLLLYNSQPSRTVFGKLHTLDSSSESDED